MRNIADGFSFLIKELVAKPSGLYGEDVVTVRLVQDERGWLQLARSLDTLGDPLAAARATAQPKMQPGN